MRVACEKLEEEMPDTAELAAILREAIGVDEMENTLWALWCVVFADGIELDVEEAVLHKVEALLGVSPKRAKERMTRSSHVRSRQLKKYKRIDGRLACLICRLYLLWPY